MQTTSNLSKNNSLRLTPQHSARRLSFCSQVATGQHLSPIVFPEKCSKVKNSKHSEISVGIDDIKKSKTEEHRIDIGDEKSDLLGYDVFFGKLVLDKGNTNKSSDANTSTDIKNQDSVDAKLTSKALVLGSQLLSLGDVVSPIKRASHGLSCFKKSGRSRKDFRFLASMIYEALQWVSGFADQQCFVNCSRHPLVSSKKLGSDFLFSDFPLEPYIKCKHPPTMLVILNPRSGHGHSSKVFHGLVELIFKGHISFPLTLNMSQFMNNGGGLKSCIEEIQAPSGVPKKTCIRGEEVMTNQLDYKIIQDSQGLPSLFSKFTLRKTEETKTELIARADIYMPVCRKHYVSGQVVKETTRTIFQKADGSV